ncbi:SMP-30 gluconolaconase LRE domain protein [Pestalotiopsis sp. 9143b]|nr:SMP-30 gluconolaconase LRE domain protein [Pestalotiopsis sp. 9143b]
MRTSTFIASAAAVAGTVYATPSAVISVEFHDNGALKNTSITVPIGTVYTDPKNLYQVSTLYLNSAVDADVNSIICTPFQNNHGTGAGGKDFSYGKPSLLSTNSVQVGSIVCRLTSSTTSITSGTATATATVGGATTIPRTTLSTTATVATPTLANTDSGATDVPTQTGTGSSGSGNGTGNGNGTAIGTSAATGTSTPVGSGVMGRDLPYMMFGLVLGAAGLMFAM